MTKNNNFFEKIHKESRPVFLLSTGRCGTKLLSKIFSDSNYIQAYHEPTPELIYYSKFAYENQNKKDDILKYIIDGARFEYIMYSVLNEKVYFEGNNRLTFFAPQLLELFPNAKFIHLVRNPADFVRSGIRRNWYTGDHLWDMGRIIPKKNDNIEWSEMSDIGKISWLWNETNKFIENFKEKIENNKIITYNSESLFSNYKTTIDIFDFIDVPIEYSDNEIKKLIEKPVNKQKKNSFPKYKDWSISQKIALKKYAKLADKYDYDL